MITPLGDRALVVLVEKEEKVVSGIVIPQTHDNAMEGRDARVLAIGPGRFDKEDNYRVPMDVEVGDTVILSRHAGTEVTDDDGTECLLVSGPDIIGKRNVS